MRQLILISFIGLMVFNFVFAQSDAVPREIPYIGDCLTAYNEIPPKIGCIAQRLGQLLALVAFVVSVVMFFLAGFDFLTKGEDEKATKAARTKLIYAAVGLAVAILSFAISFAVARLLGYVPPGA